MKMKRLQIYVEEDQYLKLKEQAEEEQISIARAIRNNLKKTNQKFKNRAKSEERFGTWLMKNRKKYSFKGPKDLSINLDKYVYGI